MMSKEYSSRERPEIPEWDADGVPELPGGIRLQKVMAAAGVGSRRVAENLITAGRVSVNGVIVTEQGMRVNPETDEIVVDGMPIQTDASKRYFMLNKPVGVVSSLKDESGRPDLSQFTAQFDERLFNVGRLDAQTSGLLILTNDGDLAHVLAHPSFNVSKTYIAKVRGKVTPQIVNQLKSGFDLDDGFINADDVRLLSTEPGGKSSMVELTLHSGRNRIVRRMMDYVGHPVIDLVRRKFGPLTLGTLGTGQLRELTKVELGHILAISKNKETS